ncbi:protein tyrosine phosphatase [Coprinopsis sp. MPI-PUGE-AT-0042]|nr:protein tyrosine phosphatase [Coprinopsis sp. MPI-PUGE-AT-0042]
MPATSKPKAATTKKSVPTPIKGYLVLYNTLSAIGWGYVLTLLIVHLFNLDGRSNVKNTLPLVNILLSRIRSVVSFGGYAYSKTRHLQASLPTPLQPIFARATTAYSRIGELTTFVQSFALLEVVHALLGWVRSPVTTTTMQVASRLFLVWGITTQFPETHANPIYASMVFAWSVTEVIRYTFYALNLLGINSSLLVWLRYTTFYVLYPLGASSEAFLTLATLPQTILPTYLHSFPPKPIEKWSIDQYARGILFLIWWPGLYAMYSYMIGQRRKVLGAPKQKTQ